MRLIAVDPGAKGGIAVLDLDGETTVRKIPDTHVEMWQFFASMEPAVLAVERAQAGPRMGSGAAFRSGYGYALIIASAYAAGIQVNKVQPIKWQESFGLVRHGEGMPFADRDEVYKSKKQEMKRLASIIYPEIRVYDWNADALLILEWLRRSAPIEEE